VKDFLRPSKKNRHGQFNTVSDPKRDQNKSAQDKACLSYEVLATIAKDNHKPTEADHHYIVEKIPFGITNPGFSDSIQFVEDSGVSFHGSFTSARRSV
jgi:hypothetical protein